MSGTMSMVPYMVVLSDLPGRKDFIMLGSYGYVEKVTYFDGIQETIRGLWKSAVDGQYQVLECPADDPFDVHAISHNGKRVFTLSEGAAILDEVRC